MNAIALYYDVPAYRQQLPSIWGQTYSVAQGPDAQQSSARAHAAMAHYSERPTLVLAFAEKEDYRYEHIPLAPSRTVKSRYRYVGRLLPREISFDD